MTRLATLRWFLGPAVSLAFGCCGAISGTIHLGALDWLGGQNAVGFTLLALALAFAAHGLLFGIAWPRLAEYSRLARPAWVVASLVTAGLLIVVVPIPAPHVADVVSLGTLVLALSTWLATRPGPSPAPVAVSRWTWVGYALPSAACWLVWLLTFWPGLLDYDPIHQWRFIHHYPEMRDDWYPPFHTMTFLIASKVWYTPASLALIQIVTLSATVGWGLARFRSLGTPAGIVWATAILIAIWPMHSAYAISLWKDTPYATAMAALSLLVLEVVVTDGAWLARRASWLLLGLTAALTALYRHNGVPVAFGTLALLLLLYWRHWRALVPALAVALVVWQGVNRPLAQAFHIQKSTIVASTLAINYVGAHVVAGTPLTDDERACLEGLGPLEVWRDNFKWVEPYFIFSDPRFRLDKLPEESERIWRIVWALTKRNPGVTLDHLMRISTSVWQITQPLDKGYFYFTTTPLSINEQGAVISVEPMPESQEWLLLVAPELRAQPILPALGLPLARFVALTQKYELDWLFWRSAFFLYLLLGGATIATLRSGTWGTFLVILPFVLQSLTMLPLYASPAARYQYPLHLGGLLFAGWLYFGIPWRKAPSLPLE